MIKYNQLRHECDTWKRSLSFIMEETLVLKARIREILSGKIDKDDLTNLENFQSRLLEEDTLLLLLRSDISELDSYLEERCIANGRKAELNKLISDRMEKLRNDIHLTENQFSFLKLEFNCYISEQIN